ncbi:MAG: glutamate--tRNA ligase [Holosporales bacterium]|jgi:glutamyl-tRNA synthetase|nr:glutamate--tRNA ligase [Holosporales bacterium]
MRYKVRFAPSPTGYMHIGNSRIAIINYLFCRKNNGKFLLRIDDSDTLRSKDEYEASIMKDLEWLGIRHDEFFKQSERTMRYSEVKAQLIERGILYECFETSEELEYKRRNAISNGRAPVYDRTSLNLTDREKHGLRESGVPSYWRFKLPDQTVTWQDIILGEISYDLRSISDPVIMKADGTFLYTFSSVVDDFDSGITHIIRGQDHVTNTAAQIAMFNAISNDEFNVNFAHISLFVNKDGSQFSKRLGSMNLGEIRDNGIDSMAIADLMATLGTSLDTISFTSMNDLIDYFDITKFSTNSPKFDIDDVVKLNRKILMNRSYDEVKERIRDEFIMDESSFSIIRENVNRYDDFIEWQNILTHDFSFHVDFSDQEKEILKTLAHEIEGAAELDDQTITEVLERVKNTASASGKNLYLPIRMALTNKSHGPHIAQIILLLGKSEVLKRISRFFN